MRKYNCQHAIQLATLTITDTIHPKRHKFILALRQTS